MGGSCTEGAGGLIITIIITIVKGALGGAEERANETNHITQS